MQKYEEIIQQSWTNEEFKSRFINDPKSVFSEMGQEIDDNITIEVHDDSLDTMHFVLLDKSQVADVPMDENSVVGKVMARAHSDESYKTRLLNEPKSAVQEILGVEPQVNIAVHANTQSHIHLVLPANPEISGELSDSDLVMVAGGKTSEEINTMVCSGMEKVFTVGANALEKVTVGGFLGTLAILAGPLMVGGASFSNAASTIE